MKWTWDGGFRAYKRSLDGSIEEKTFTSHASARIFVERTENVTLHKGRHVRVHPSEKQKKKGGNSKTPSQLTPEQQELVQAAMRQFKGL